MARSKTSARSAFEKRLRLPTFLREYDKLARQCAAESLDSRSFLQQLCELELLDREQRGHRAPHQGREVSRDQESGHFRLPVLGQR